MSKDDKNNVDNKNVESKHEWDGITEYTNPDPMWLRITFYLTVFFALGYWILYPSWPTPNESGLLNWTSENQLKEELDKVHLIRNEYKESFDAATFEEIMKNEKLMHYARLSGQSIFENNCAICHGSGGGGNVGYPNLTAGSWLWGGTLENIQYTILHGIRSDDPDARDSQMPAFGKDKLLSNEDIKLLAYYSIYLANKQSVDINLDKANMLFQENCASCHGANAKGNNVVGAPNLTDAIWLYGNDYESVYDTIYNGRAGKMPYWKNKLTDSEIKSVSIYVHQLGGGE